MDKTIHIRNDTFEANILLGALLELPTKKIRKLFQLTMEDPRNARAQELIEEWMADTLAEAKADWKSASADYTAGWKLHPRGAYEIKRNRQLQSKLKAAKARHDRIIKIQTSYQELNKRRFYIYE